MMTDEQRLKIKELKEHGWGWKEIELAVGQKSGTCKQYWKRYRKIMDLPQKSRSQKPS
jgi:hypothetical protein